MRLYQIDKRKRVSRIATEDKTQRYVLTSIICVYIRNVVRLVATLVLLIRLGLGS